MWCESVCVRPWQVVQLKAAKLFGVVWHDEQARPAWRPDVIGNHVWLNVPCCQVLSLARWHDWQVVGKPAAVWFGFAVRW